MNVNYKYDICKFTNGHYDYGIRNIYIIFGSLKLKGKALSHDHITYLYWSFIGLSYSVR